MTGTIVRVYPDKKFGFIKGSDGVDYFFHASSLKNARFESLVSGQEMEFENVEGQKGPRAESVYISGS